MIQFIPLIDWAAALTSITLLIVLWREGGLGGVELGILGAWFAAALGVQFFSASLLAARIALALQTLLAAYLIIRWRISG